MVVSVGVSSRRGSQVVGSSSCEGRLYIHSNKPYKVSVLWLGMGFNRQ